MSLIGKMREKWKLRQEKKGVGRLVESPAPVIETKWGNVTEAARLQAAINMREDPKKRADVEALLARQLFEGDIDKGRKESKRRYREAYE